VDQHSPSFYQRAGKRLFDLSIGLIIAVLTLPIQLVVGVFVRRRLGSPVLFRQERPGRNGQPFEMVKFRMMTNERDSDDELLPDPERLPPFGLIHSIWGMRFADVR